MVQDRTVERGFRNNIIKLICIQRKKAVTVM